MKKKLIIGAIILICLLVLVAVISICDLMGSIGYHYGTYNGAVVFDSLPENTACVITWKYIAGYFFYSPDSYIMDVWYMGRYYSLNDAYKKGILSDEDIKDIYNQYISIHPEYEEELQKLQYLYYYYDSLSNEEKVIVDAYNNGSVDNMGCINKYYCELENGAIVVDMEVMYSWAGSTILNIEIADLVFEFPTIAGSIEVFYEGEFTDLSDAYENGIVSYDELVEVHNIHNNK